MNCIFLAISEVRDSWRLAKERGPLYPEVFIRGRQTFHGLCTFNKGLSTKQEIEVFLKMMNMRV